MSIDQIAPLDLDAARRQRAAAREGARQAQPIIIGGATIATLPVELPVEVLAPLQALSGDLTLLVRKAMEFARGTTASQEEITDLVIDVLISNPGLPVTAFEIARDVTTKLLGQQGLDALMASKPSREDMAFLIKGVFAFYGVSLGEASPSSDSSTGGSGGTSPGTSSTTSGSTPDGSGETPQIPTSSEPAAS